MALGRSFAMDMGSVISAGDYKLGESNPSGFSNGDP